MVQGAPSVGRPRCCARSRIAFHASFEGSACEFSHRFTVDTVTAISCANSSCVIPSCWRSVRIMLRVLSGMRGTEQPTCHRPRACPRGPTRRSPQRERRKPAAGDQIPPRACRTRRDPAMAGAMIFVHETHDLQGGKADEFSEAFRTTWRPLLEEDASARLLWYWDVPHGT